MSASASSLLRSHPSGPVAPPGAPAPEGVPGIATAGLSKRFGPVRALEAVTLEVPMGAVTAVVGRNGAGKSTLIRVLATSVLPDGGTAAVCGHDVVDQPLAVRQSIGLALGEDRSFFWRLSGRQNLEFFARLYGLRGRVAAGRVEEVLGAVGLLDVAGRRVDRYSTGMRSRLGIARALVGSPRVLLLDEPTRSLDPVAAESVRELLEGVVAGDRCVLLATHDLEEAAAVAAQIVVMRGGAVVARRHPPFDLEGIRDDIRGEK